MSVGEVEELGPIDYVVVEFPGTHLRLKGEAAAAITDLVDKKLVRILDFVLIRKDVDGTVEGFEVSDLGDEQLSDVRHLADVAALLSEHDVESIAECLEADTTAAVLVWENTWAAPLGAAVRRAGGQLVASGRIPVQAIVTNLGADEEREGGE